MDRSSYQLKPFIWSSHTLIGQMLGKSKYHRVLDVGCDEGFIGQVLGYDPKELIGIDKRKLNSKPPRYLKIIKLDIEKDSLTAFKKDYFEVIILSDILEHLNSPDLAIRKLKSLLRKNGIFLISVPNMNFWLVRLFDIFSFRPRMKRGIFDKTHQHDFTLKKITELANNCDLTTVKAQFAPMPLPVVSGIFNRGGMLFFIYELVWKLTGKFPSLLAYQIIIVAKPKND